ncbi:MAG: cupin domain-containing protein [Thermoanaerobaculia bacterium]
MSRKERQRLVELEAVRRGEQTLSAAARCCEVEHVVLVTQGRMVVVIRDGEQVEVGPGDLCHIPPGHDAWVVGDEPYVSLHFVGTDEYARKTR